MKSAKDVVEAYNKKYKKEVVEDRPKFSQSDLNAKAIVESLIENTFSVDAPTKKDAAAEIVKLAESNSVFAQKMFELFDNVTSNCSVDENGIISIDVYNLKRKY